MHVEELTLGILVLLYGEEAPYLALPVGVIVLQWECHWIVPRRLCHNSVKSARVNSIYDPLRW